MNKFWPEILANIVKAKSLLAGSIISPTIDNLQSQIDNNYNVAEITTNTTLTETNATVFVTVSGVTVQLPQATIALVGKEFTVSLCDVGYCDVTTTSPDLIWFDTLENAVRLNMQGQSMTFKVLEVGKWGVI